MSEWGKVIDSLLEEVGPRHLVGWTAIIVGVLLLLIAALMWHLGI